MDEYAVLVFRGQPLSDDEHLAFAQRLDGRLHAKTGSSVRYKNRLGTEALSDISNVDEHGGLLKPDDRRRMYSLGNRLWHTDASFQDPAGRYSMLSAKIVPPVSADTEFADMRAAYDALPAEIKARVKDLRVHHSIAHSRQILGFEFSRHEQEALKGAIHPLVRTIPRSRRRSLYLAAHAARIIDWPVPEGRLLLRDLMEHATQPEFVYRHLAGRRPRDLGQPRHDAPRSSLRRRHVPAGTAPHHDARRRSAERRDQPFLTASLPS